MKNIINSYMYKTQQQNKSNGKNYFKTLFKELLVKNTKNDE